MSNVPPEILEKLEDLHDGISGVEKAFAPLSQAYEVIQEQAQSSPLLRARLDLMLAFVGFSVCVTSLAARGIDWTKEEKVTGERDRIMRGYERLKAIDNSLKQKNKISDSDHV